MGGADGQVQLQVRPCCTEHGERLPRADPEPCASQVIDDAGVDRTPRPLVSLDPSSMRNLSSATGQSTPNSDASEFMFLQRLPSATFSRQGTGIASGATSGTVTPKSDDSDYEMSERASGFSELLGWRGASSMKG